MAINFGPNMPWGGVSQREYQRMARDQRHTLTYRVYFAALGWANQIGHAEFAEKELNGLLGKGGKPLSRQSLRDAITRATRLDLVLPESGTRCLVLGHWQFQKGWYGTKKCRTHGIEAARAA
ncbi:hypothetical protein ACI784_19045 [Geodermatophilus sp. SYSU D01186]